MIFFDKFPSRCDKALIHRTHKINKVSKKLTTTMRSNFEKNIILRGYPLRYVYFITFSHYFQPFKKYFLIFAFGTLQRL